ncbi:MAG: hypothetical protein ACREPG_00920 [Candidatus Binatia bacterium]
MFEKHGLDTTLIYLDGGSRVARPPLTTMARKARLNSLAEPSDFGFTYYTNTPIVTRSAKPEEFADSSFVKELDDSGFIGRAVQEQEIIRLAAIAAQGFARVLKIALSGSIVRASIGPSEAINKT